MFGQRSFSVVAVALLMLPAQLMAGGIPRLYLPVNNIESMGAADQCSKQIARVLGKRASAVTMQVHKGQWYASISLLEDVGLTDVQGALANSPCSVPRENLTLAGSAQLLITVRTKFLDDFFKDLEEIEGQEINETSRDKNGVLVTVNQNDLCRNLTEAAQHSGPSYDAIKELVEDHNAELVDVRWSGSWHCRGVFGCLATSGAAQEQVTKK